jgi:hypothetical protein
MLAREQCGFEMDLELAVRLLQSHNTGRGYSGRQASCTCSHVTIVWRGSDHTCVVIGITLTTKPRSLSSAVLCVETGDFTGPACST